METKWVELLHGDSHPKEVREGLEKLLSGVSEEFAYSEYALKAKNGNKLIISWHNVPRPASWNGGIGLLLSGSDVTERKHAEEEKAVLLREVYHRTKNNMSIIISLLTLQGGQIENPIFQQMLLDTRNRILSMAIVHSKLYSSQSLARIGLVEYVRELSSNLLVTFYGSSEAVYMAIQGEDVLVDLETAVPTGLVINEILTNAFKHAFSETQGRRKIKLDIREESGYICVEYQDNGCGLPEAVLLKHGGGLGMQLIDNIVRHQLNGTVTLQNINGTHISLTIQKGAQ
ncbi:MAG: histidine kinase dimerization/phosphoacceptor domain -containing protein [Spirochaetia bacterium]|nr:histidine kinase dimerization/phosphoacceptor domain -containing protein [Spirochaetia bacterium]